jgi:hypothetical protein
MPRSMDKGCPTKKISSARVGHPFVESPEASCDLSEVTTPRVPRAAAFASAPHPAALPLRSAKPPPSCRPGFQLVPQPESHCASLLRPRAPAALPTSSLRSRCASSPAHRANAPLRSFPAERQGQRDPRVPLGDVFKSVFCAVLLPIALTSLLIEPGAGRGSS